MTYFCNCTKFVQWYTSQDLADTIHIVCVCGHPRTMHVKNLGTCLGDVEIVR